MIKKFDAHLKSLIMHKLMNDTTINYTFSWCLYICKQWKNIEKKIEKRKKFEEKKSINFWYIYNHNLT